MLHLQPLQDLPLPDGPGQGGAGEFVDLALGFLLRQYLVIFFTVLLAGVAGVIFLVVRPPSYTAQAKISIETQKPQFVQQQSLLAYTPLDQSQMESQLQILQSTAVLAPVVQKLKLADDPEFGSPPGGLIQRVFQVFTNPTSAEPKLDPIETAIATLTDRLIINRVGWSFLIEIGVSSQSPEKSAQIANAVSTAYIDDQQKTKREANRSGSVWLQERMQQLAEQTTAAERATVAFKQKNNIISAGGKRIDEQNLADLNTRLVAVRTQSSELSARVTQLDSIIRNWDVNGGTVNEHVSDEIILGAIGNQGGTILGDLRREYLDVARKEAEWSPKYGRNHGAVVNLRNRLRDLRISSLEELRRVAAATRSDYAIAKQHAAEIEKQLNQVISQSEATNKAQVTLRELESTANTYHSLYESFLQRYTGGLQQELFSNCGNPNGLFGFATNNQSQA